jgi:hypothetical protein
MLYLYNLKFLTNENKHIIYIEEVVIPLLNSFQSYIDGKNSNDKKFIMDIFEKKEKGNLIEWYK